MFYRYGQFVRFILLCAVSICGLFLLTNQSAAVPYAAMVIDARTGEVLHSRNADTRLHPASLTKMMTLYVVFEAVENGEISLDDVITISANAEAEPASELGLVEGQRIRLRYLIRAAAVKSANDAATAIAEAVGGSEQEFIDRMNATAQALGMTNTTFRNAHGLTMDGHRSTARDMTTLGRALFFHYRDYYNLFSRDTAYVGVGTVRNTNRRLLDNYEGADGIKTGYTSAAGYNLVSSARRGNEHVIATVFGAHNSAWRYQRVTELLDMGFDRSPTHAAVRAPAQPRYGVIRRTELAVAQSPRPVLRPTLDPEIDEELLIAIDESIEEALEEVLISEEMSDAIDQAVAEALVEEATLNTETEIAAIEQPAEPEVGGTQVVTRLSTSGGRYWGVSVGTFPSEFDATRMLFRTALIEMSTLEGALHRVNRRDGGYEASFMGMTSEMAELACRRLIAQQVACETIGPPS